MAPGEFVVAPGTAHPSGSTYGIFRSLGGGWRPVARMVAPAQLPVFPRGITARLFPAGRRAEGDRPRSSRWVGFESALAKRVFGKEPDGSPNLVSSDPPDGSEETSYDYWRTPPNPVA